MFLLFFRATDDGDGTETSHERSAGVKLSRPTGSLPGAVCAWATASKVKGGQMVIRALDVEKRFGSGFRLHNSITA